jgi:AAA domain
LIIDEAGMADTLSLDIAVRFAVDRGASVRLIGDDQQLAAIGAGGVLRDIKNIHGALQLTELHRFTDPAEAQASLALREGDPSALGFYLDHGRVHVGDLAKITKDAFAAWISDRAVGLDAIMLAPTRQRVAELNRRAREHRLDGAPVGREVRLGDGKGASVGDMIITRANDRRLRLSATDWVKNGDRWTITRISRRGDLTVRHSRSQLKCQLPADYVTTSTGLGYATTVHGAQGVSADTMHGLLTGQESRPQLYTMLSRGRHANHLYLQVVGDGDPHSLIRPETIAPPTPTETLQQILARDEAPVSASTVLRELNSPAARLRQAASATPTASTSQPNSSSDPKTAQISTASTRTSPDSPPNPPGQPCGPICSTSRPKLESTHSATCRQPPPGATFEPQAIWPPSSIGASQNSRLSAEVRCPGSRAFQRCSMPIRSGGAYLAKRSQLVADLADQIQDHACQRDAEPIWAAPGTHPSTALIGDIAVWRAANGINSQDPRPTGGTQLETLPALWKQRLDRDIARAANPAADVRADEPHAGRSALSPRDGRQRPYQQPERRPSGPSAPGR